MVQNLSLYLGVTAAAATALLLWILFPLLLRIMDKPNARSMHVNPVPRSGGVAIMIVALTMLVLVAATTDALPRSFGPMLVGTVLLAVTGLVDDIKGLKAGTRLVTQSVAVAIPCVYLPVDGLLFQGFVPFWFDRLVLIGGWLWFLNLYNFMDGIDGITGTETASLGAGILILSAFTVLPAWLPVSAAILLGCAIGFLIWNWHPARLFMGDVGSVPLGFMLAYLLIYVAISGWPWAAALLPLYYLMDASFTLIYRLWNKRPPFQAHRSHGYQRAVQGGLGVRRVCLIILILNGVSIVAAIATAQLADIIAIGCIGAAMAINALTLAYFYRRFAVSLEKL